MLTRAISDIGVVYGHWEQAGAFTSKIKP